MWLLVSGMHRQLPGQRTVIGYRKDQFAPTDLVTREQLPIMLQGHWKHGDNGEHRYFTDVSSWAKESLCWAVENYIMQGSAKITSIPKATSSRAEAAALMAKLHRTINTNE